MNLDKWKADLKAIYAQIDQLLANSLPDPRIAMLQEQAVLLGAIIAREESGE